MFVEEDIELEVVVEEVDEDFCMDEEWENEWGNIRVRAINLYLSNSNSNSNFNININIYYIYRPGCLAVKNRDLKQSLLGLGWPAPRSPHS